MTARPPRPRCPTCGRPWQDHGARDRKARADYDRGRRAGLKGITPEADASPAYTRGYARGRAVAAAGGDKEIRRERARRARAQPAYKRGYRDAQEGREPRERGAWYLKGHRAWFNPTPAGRRGRPRKHLPGGGAA